MSFVEFSANVREFVRELFVEVNCVRNKWKFSNNSCLIPRKLSEKKCPLLNYPRMSVNMSENCLLRLIAWEINWKFSNNSWLIPRKLSEEKCSPLNYPRMSASAKNSTHYSFHLSLSLPLPLTSAEHYFYPISFPISFSGFVEKIALFLYILVIVYIFAPLFIL